MVWVKLRREVEKCVIMTIFYTAQSVNGCTLGFHLQDFKIRTTLTD